MTRLRELLIKAHGSMLLCASLNKRADLALLIEKSISYWEETIRDEADEEPEPLRHVRD